MNPFKQVNKLKNMKQSRTTILGIIGLIGVGAFLSVVYAAGTIISDTGITTPSLTITNPGGCSGCGGSVTVSYNVTSADVLNAVVIPPTQFHYISIFINSTATYDGHVEVDQQKQDGSWQLIQSLTQADHRAQFVDGLSNSDVNNGAFAIKYPFTFRAIVTQQATMGSALLEVTHN